MFHRLFRMARVGVLAGIGFLMAGVASAQDRFPQQGWPLQNQGISEPVTSTADEFTAAPATEFLPAEDQNVAGIRVILPPDAQVSFDGNVMSQSGPMREFYSPPIDPGTYTYELEAYWFDPDRGPVRETKTLTVRPGEMTTVTLGE